MPLEIHMTNVNIEAGQLAAGVDENNKPVADPAAPWVVGFHDTFTNIVLKVVFDPAKLRETCEALIGALDGNPPKKKPDLVLANRIPTRNVGR